MPDLSSSEQNYKFTSDVSSPLRVSRHGHGVAVISRDYDQRFFGVRHFESGFDGLVKGHCFVESNRGLQKLG